MLVSGPIAALRRGYLALEVVVIEVFRQANEHLAPDGLVHEDAKSVVGPGERLAMAQDWRTPDGSILRRYSRGVDGFVLIRGKIA